MGDRLLDIYDAVLFDLDGTVYRGEQAVPGAAEAVGAVRDNPTTVRFITNNASRSPRQVADHLVALGVPTEPDEVSTSAQAAAAMLAERLAPGATVLVVGADSLADEVRLVGLRPVAEASPTPDAVVQGLDRSIGWRELSEAVLAVRAGALWVACNVDATLPTERGQLIGNGALVAAVATATGRQPLVAGKPNRPLLDQAGKAAGARRPLVVGDRLDTDIAGAAAAELDALLVLSGVSQPADVLLAGSRLRPRYLAADVTAVTGRVADLAIAGQPDWMITLDGHTLRVRWASEDRPPDALDLLRGLCAAYVPDGDDVTSVDVVAEDDVAGAALAQLGLRDRLA
ncbi:MAG TPA: HAD-IIA family hydrolase [Actinophytocola sp.]|uniref:HAD-IIA family hydrolase n=1 Tax=Actinophytocola sp. TaxID=1872138 RepID=UPI002DDCB10A|nr:HAD-IIA family hydrolase [Actinophytocola sp.]HEV2778645.1 HAD-IIA family hydrolase [Actinophytocola sp.]